MARILIVEARFYSHLNDRNRCTFDMIAAVIETQVP